jgi:hypothetical protein
MDLLGLLVHSAGRNTKRPMATLASRSGRPKISWSTAQRPEQARSRGRHGAAPAPRLCRTVTRWRSTIDHGLEAQLDNGQRRGRNTASSPVTCRRRRRWTRVDSVASARSGVAAQSSSAIEERGGGGTAPSLGLQRLSWDCWTSALRR